MLGFFSGSVFQHWLKESRWLLRVGPILIGDVLRPYFVVAELNRSPSFGDNCVRACARLVRDAGAVVWILNKEV